MHTYLQIHQIVFIPSYSSLHVNHTSVGASLAALLVKNCLQSGRTELNPWVGKITWWREQLPTPVFCPGKFHEQYSPWGCKESDGSERLSHTSTKWFKKTIKSGTSINTIESHPNRSGPKFSTNRENCVCLKQFGNPLALYTQCFQVSNNNSCAQGKLRTKEILLCRYLSISYFSNHKQIPSGRWQGWNLPACRVSSVLLETLRFQVVDSTVVH